jgi:hypothetical protein
MNPRPVYREVQQFRAWWLIALIALIALTGWVGFIQQIILGEDFGDKPVPDVVIWIIWILIGIGVPIYFWRTRMIVEVYDDHIHIQHISIIRRDIAMNDIQSAEAVKYNPIRDYGGWGYRWWLGKNSVAYNVSGNEGVRLILRGAGRDILIGSQHAAELASAIQNAMNSES